MEIVKIIAEELQISEQQVQTVIEMIDEGLTIPFIARYRKEVTGSLNDEVLRAFDTRLTYLRNLDERMNTVINSIEEQGLLTEELKAQVLACKTMTELEDVYRPYKPKKKTRASVAKEKGLEPLAKYILAQKEEKPLIEYAKEFINEEKKVTSVAEAIQGALDIIAEIVADDADYRKRAKKIFFEFGKIVTKENIRDEKGTFDMYKDYQEPIAKIASHRVLAINRGENMKCLKVTFDLPHDDILDYIKKKIIIANSPFGSELSLTIEDAYKRLILPSIESEIRNELTEKAEDSSIVVFKENLHQLLLVAPVKHKVVLGFDPGFAHGCKLAVVDENGKVLDTGVVYPTPPRNQIDLSKKIVGAMILKHKINVVAIGNGTASRESQAFIKELLQELADKHQCTFTVVSEAGASIYSATKLAAKEFPDFDTNLRSAVSIARRLQDPLAELVKIPPEGIGVGQYQHDMNQKKLRDELGGVVETCVNSVGVDVNSASPSLLEYVSGINSTIAENIVAYREQNGAFKNRSELNKVNKLGNKAFMMCAGFLRIAEGYPLDNTGVHPESYEAALNLLKKYGLSDKDLNTDKCLSALNSIKDTEIASLATELNVGEPTLKDIIEELKKPGRDPREDIKSAELRLDALEIKDLKEGMILEGTVRNIMDFGVFVDIGVHHDGFIHISELSTKFVKHPFEIVKLNQIVKVKVISVDVEKERIGLSLKQVTTN